MNKRKKKEELVLQRAVTCMERAANVIKVNDGDDVFGQYVLRVEGNCSPINEVIY